VVVEDSGQVIRFLSTRLPSGKSNLGLAILPDDLARLMNGDPEFVELAELTDLDPATLESVCVYFFRDKYEFQAAIDVAKAGPGAEPSKRLEELGK